MRVGLGNSGATGFFQAPEASVTFQHGLLLLGRADEPADPVDHLALGIHFSLFGFLAQEDGGDCKGQTEEPK